MPRISAHRASISIACIVLVSALAGCGESVSVGSKTLYKSEVEKNVREQLTRQVGQQAPPIKCPDDLESKVGARMTCSLSDGRTTYDVAIKVTKTGGGRATFDIKVANQPR